MPRWHILRSCLRYRQECEVHGIDFRRRNIALICGAIERAQSVRLEVNRNITPQPNLGGVATEEWLVSPAAGDYSDYAVTKRHELLERGWPSRALLLSEVVVPSGEHHLVLVVRMRDVDQAAEDRFGARQSQFQSTAGWTDALSMGALWNLPITRTTGRR